MEHGSGDFYTENGWYDTNNALFKESWMQFARSLAQGHVVVSDLYSNTQVMTGDVVCGLGSSAAILYYNDTVTYPDNTQEPMDLHVLPIPKTAGADALMTQAGVGLCAYKTTEQKAEAAALFVRWLTEAERNLDFVAQTGYMPVRNGAFDDIETYDKFPEPVESYQQLYAALKTMRENDTPVSEPRFEGYYGKVTALYDGLRQLQQELPARAAGTTHKISEQGIRYSSLPAHTTEQADAQNKALSAKWSKLRGIEIDSLGVSGVKASEEDEQMIKDLQRSAAFMDPTRAAAHLVGAQAAAMQSAAANTSAGPAMAFMGMNQAAAAGGVNAENAAAYAAAGAVILVTSWPYWGRPRDVKMTFAREA